MPLRPALFHGLCNAGLGEVQIAHPNEEMSAAYQYDPAVGKTVLKIRSPGEYYKVNCPFCYDTRHRLWINYMWGHDDPETRSRNLWLAHCYNENCLDGPDAWMRQNALYNRIFPLNFNKHLDSVNRGEPFRELVETDLPGTVSKLHDLENDHPANIYLRSRGFDPDFLSKWLYVGVCVFPDPRFPMAYGRIIIPVVQDGKLYGWQARHVGHGSSKMKYYNLPGMQRNQLIYNWDVATRYNFVVITEGVTKVWRFGPEAVALFGKTMSLYQNQKLVTGYANATRGVDKLVVIMLDANATPSAAQIYDDLKIKHKVTIHLPINTEPCTFETPVLREMVFNACAKAGYDLGDPHGFPGISG